LSSDITPILMPKWGLSMKEGTLAAWHVEEGTAISPGDEIMDVETDKIANVVEAADGGLLRRRVGQEGEIYPVRALLGVLAPEAVSDDEIETYVQGFELPVVAEDEEEEPAYAFAELSAGKIRYAERPGEGTPIVLIHGFGGDLDNWLFNIDALAASAPVYALDLPGHGQSVRSVDGPNLDLMVETVVEFMDHVGATSAHLVGHSMGGLIAGSVAIRHPDRAATVGLICSAGLGDEINNGYIDGFIQANSRKELKLALLNLFADQSLVGRSLVNDLLKYKRLDGVSAFLSTLRDSVFANGAQAVRMSEELSSLGKPVMVIWGAEDAVIPADHAGTIDGVEPHVLEGAGHMVQMEKASEVNELIKGLL